VKAVIIEILEVDQLDAGCAEQAVIEGSPQVFVIEKEGDLFEGALDLVRVGLRVDPGQALAEEVGGEISAFVPVGCLE
jgi:hypothetical protein